MTYPFEKIHHIRIAVDDIDEKVKNFESIGIWIKLFFASLFPQFCISSSPVGTLKQETFHKTTGPTTLFSPPSGPVSREYLKLIIVRVLGSDL